MCTRAYRGTGVSCLKYKYALLCCCLMVSSFICRNFALPLFKKDVLVRNGCFYPMRSIFIFIKQAFFILNCVSEPKLANILLILIK